MRIPDSLVTEILVNANKLKEVDVDAMIEESRNSNTSVQELVLKKQVVSEKELTQLYAKEIDVPFIELSQYKIDQTLLKQIPEHIARKYNAVLYAIDKDIPKLAMDDPDDLQAIDFLQKRLGQSTEISIATSSDIMSALDEYKGEMSSEISKVAKAESDEDDSAKPEDEVSEEDISEDSPIAQTVNLLVEYAIKQKASDIHIEPRENIVQVRYRIDGILREANRLPRKIANALVSRIKILSNLKIDEHRAPQDGRFKTSLNGHLYALRVSTLPIMDGEKVVMRILNESTKPLNLEQLGYWGYSLDSIRDAIAQPHGIILVTGPTGSGKSTTLYSVLNILNTPGVNISTVEDPVEYRISGTNQTQVNSKAGMTFANGLRALLRQDPNIIMVGEIRDSETANLAIQAALTGHLVFSTLHTNNAATALPRLLEMGIEPFLIASTVRVVVAQRLVRRLNPDMSKTYSPDEKHMKELTEMFDIKSAISQLGQAEKDLVVIGDNNKSDASDKKAEAKTMSESKLQLWGENIPDKAPPGTSAYEGRMGIYEVLNVTEEIEQAIVSDGTTTQIQDIAVKQGMVTMQQDGFIKALQGLTTLEEIMRVTRE